MPKKVRYLYDGSDDEFAQEEEGEECADLPERAEIRQAYLDRIYGSLSERQVLKLRRMAIIERRDQ